MARCTGVAEFKHQQLLLEYVRSPYMTYLQNLDKRSESS